MVVAYASFLLFGASGRKISTFWGYEKGGPALYLKWISSAIAPKDGSESETSIWPVCQVWAECAAKKRCRRV